MKVGKADTFTRLCFLYPLFAFSKTSIFSSAPHPRVLIPNNVCLFCSSSVSLSTSKDSADVFRSIGCSSNDISIAFRRQPSLVKANPTILSSKLTLLLDLGLTSSDLIKIINCRPRVLACRIGRGLGERIDFLHCLFGSKEMLLKAIVRNPSLLNYELNLMKQCVSLYEELGVSKKDLIPMLISRPTTIPRSSFNDEKLDFIRRTGISNNSKMYKYVVSLIAVSRLDTIRAKVMNLEKFGISGDEVMLLMGRSPFLLTLSVDKVQRNMTFVIGTLKLPATVILQSSFLLYSNLESVLRPRYLVGEKIKALGLLPLLKGPTLLRALRMTESRFLKAFVSCHPKTAADELTEVYTKAKAIKRLAATSRRNFVESFPF